MKTGSRNNKGDIMSSAFDQYTMVLANEGINVLYKPNAKTAYFDLKTRTVVMPTFEYMDQTVSQLFLSHEASHAKNSDYDLDKFRELNKKYKSLFNIIEDIRIEKLIISEFPGLSNIFKEAYKILMKNNFFGEDLEKNISSYNFLDRINIYFKSYGLINVPFSKEESSIILKLSTVHTKEDVIKYCEELYQYLAESQTVINIPQELIEMALEENELNGEEDDFSSIEIEIDEDQNGKNEKNKKDSNQWNPQRNSKKDDFDQEVNDGESEDEVEAQEGNGKEPDLSSKTDEALKENLEKYANEQFKIGVPKEPLVINSNVVKEKELYYDLSPMMNLLDNCFNTIPKVAPSKELRELCAEVKETAKTMTSVFKNKQTARNLKNQKYKNSGLLNMSRLAHYKTSDNIFKRITIQPNQKNHGMMLLIDLSGSMSGSITGVLFQTAIITEFCKDNDIPFEVIGFGASPLKRVPMSGKYNPNFGTEYIHPKNIGNRGNTICTIKIADSLHYSLPALLSFYHRKLDEILYKLITEYNQNHSKKLQMVLDNFEYYDMGCTPLDIGILSSISTLNKYKIAGIDKTIFMIITDGSWNFNISCILNLNDDVQAISIDFNTTIINGKKVSGEEYIEKKYFDGNVFTSTKFCVPDGRGTQYKDPSFFACSSTYIDNLLYYIKDMFNSTIILSYLYNGSETYGLKLEYDFDTKERIPIRYYNTFIDRVLCRVSTDDLLKKSDCCKKMDYYFDVNDFGNANNNPVFDKVMTQSARFFAKHKNNIKEYKKNLKEKNDISKVQDGFSNMASSKNTLKSLARVFIDKIS